MILAEYLKTTPTEVLKVSKDALNKSSQSKIY